MDVLVGFAGRLERRYPLASPIAPRLHHQRCRFYQILTATLWLPHRALI